MPSDTTFRNEVRQLKRDWDAMLLTVVHAIPPLEQALAKTCKGLLRAIDRMPARVRRWLGAP